MAHLQAPKRLKWLNPESLLTRLDYLLRETGLGLRRGGWMNWAAISTMTVLLFLFGISLQTSWQIDGLLNQVGSQLEVSVYLKPGVAVAPLRSRVVKLPQVARVEIISKEQAWQELLADMGTVDIADAAADLGGNPLVDELKVKAQTPAAVPKLAKQLTQLPEVDGVQYLEDALSHLQKLGQGLNWVGLTVTTILTVTAISVITTTIRLIVLARRHEIEVMQLVGATTTWIYLPFVLQGVAFGLIGAVIAWSFIAATQRFIAQLLTQQPNFLRFLATGLQLSPLELALLPLVLLGFGAVVGLVGSLVAVRRFAVR